MISPLNLRHRLRRFAADESGTATVEFAVIFPAIFLLFLWAIELGIYMSRAVSLEHALDTTMRELRLGNIEAPTAATIKQEICENATLIADCLQSITLELQPISTTTWAMPSSEVSCVDVGSNVAPATTFNPGSQNQVMLVRTCVIVDPVFPGDGFSSIFTKDPSGRFGLSAVSAFVNEPSS